jgi:hypothetical protein
MADDWPRGWRRRVHQNVSAVTIEIVERADLRARECQRIHELHPVLNRSCPHPGCCHYSPELTLRRRRAAAREVLRRARQRDGSQQTHLGTVLPPQLTTEELTERFGIGKSIPLAWRKSGIGPRPSRAWEASNSPVWYARADITAWEITEEARQLIGAVGGRHVLGDIWNKTGAAVS